MKQTLLTICLIVFALPSWANEKFSINGDTIIYDTFKAADETLAEINWEDTNVLAKILSENPNIKTLQLNSLGGIIDAAEYMSDIIIDFELNTHVVGECSNSFAHPYSALLYS